jgi:hypothetical protein
LIETYILRRAICSVPTNTLNRTFASFADGLNKSCYLESIEARFLSLSGRYRFPDDAEFSHELKTSSLYGRRSLTYLLRRLENEGRKEPVPVHEFTIEHILPQNPELSEPWRTDLGTDWQNVQATWLHTLGNLTLTGYNSEYSDRPFAAKRDMAGGFASSPLRLNEGLGQLDVWNEHTIKARGEQLANRSVAIWPLPTPSAAVLAEVSAPPLAGTSSDEDEDE